MANNSPRVQKQFQLAKEMQTKSRRPKALGPTDANAEATTPTQRIEASEPNRTGLPDELKTGMENLSGMAMDDVRVHYNSDKPAQLNALAYAQGSDIHVGPGQEKHLPHEAWHIVQQRQGRVRPTTQMKTGIPVNDDKQLEDEASVMGARAMQTQAGSDLDKSPVKPAHSGSHATAQMFRPLAPKDYTLNREEEDDSPAFFTTQSKDPELKRSRRGNYSVAHEIERSNAKQNLKLSDDGTMAINNTAAEAKEFYAADSVLGDSTAKLAAANSQVKLVKNGGLSIGTEGKTLSKIIPVPADEQQEQNAGEFASLVSHICIEMASGVMGIQNNAYEHEAVFQAPGQEEQSVANITSPVDKGDEKIERLAAGLAKSKKGTTREELREGIHSGAPVPPLPGKAYGKLSGRDQLTRRERAMGVNRFAQPDVGEGYATFTLSGHPTQNIDYSAGDEGVDRLANIWGYHFAGVVARSDDKKDSITLENYNRADDVFKQLHILLRRLVNGHKEKMDAEVAKTAAEENPHRSEIQMKLTEALQVARGLTDQQAQQEFLRILASYTSGQSWFFQMYGSGEGQSFHEQQAESGAFANPLTLRVRPRDPAREALRSDRKNKLVNFPGPAGAIAGQPEFNGLAALKNSCVKELEDAETADLIRTKFADGLSRVAAYLIQGSADLAVRLAIAGGAAVNPNTAQAVGAKNTIGKKAGKAADVHRGCRTALQAYFGTLWFYQKQQKRDVQTALTNVEASRVFAEATKNHYLAVR